MELFKVGSRAHHIHAGVEVVIERDDGGETVHVGYRGGKSQRVPRGVLVAVKPPKPRESTSRAAGSTSEKQRKPADDLRMFMREIQTMEDLASLIAKHSLNMALSPAVSFGMSKMRAFSLLKGMLSRREITREKLWSGIRQ